MGYLQEFLFSPDRARQKVKVLSGGERNRLLLARLFTKTSNLLIMDEPTNDLDVETLELLEELLVGYAGTLLLVSHDRAFLNNVVTSTIVLEGNGTVYEHPGGYDDWLYRRKDKTEEMPAAVQKEEKTVPSAMPETKPAKPKKLTIKEQKELDALPGEIEKLDAEEAQIVERMATPGFYMKDTRKIAETKTRLTAITEERPKLYARWEELEKRRPQNLM